ncbi:hypothetical protein QYE76_071064 [Lolium multiflorum]|uniref:SAM-dependent methyltransferase Erg6/SMT-type domain-containing protein n=1 Tax=Lolium multiflorum TaxID=4521 RepID=A0AAD8SKG4_LOLMU|nr:hypothetical protein QYE76_071064 [Lolium multiflorum]
MRAIAAHSGSKVVGITINDYQVNRARAHNRKAGLDSQCEVVCGNFMAMPFPDASFDGAYSIEATCHAPRLQDVYAEVFRVLKPGGLYVSYEWVTTALYRADDPASRPSTASSAATRSRGLATTTIAGHRQGRWASRSSRSSTSCCPPPCPGGCASRQQVRVLATPSSSASSPCSGSRPRAWWRSTRCSSTPPSTSPSAARPESSRPCTWCYSASPPTPHQTRANSYHHLLPDLEEERVRNN